LLSELNNGLEKDREERRAIAIGISYLWYSKVNVPLTVDQMRKRKGPLTGCALKASMLWLHRRQMLHFDNPALGFGSRMGSTFKSGD
jgi:hypothetical protein